MKRIAATFAFVLYAALLIWLFNLGHVFGADIGTGSPPRPPVAAPKVAPIAPKVATPTPKAAPIVRPRGYHEHRCAACGTVWGHGSDSYGNAAAHTCPRCGRIQWQRADGRSDAPPAAVPCPT